MSCGVDTFIAIQLPVVSPGILHTAVKFSSACVDGASSDHAGKALHADYARTTHALGCLHHEPDARR